MAPRPRHYWLMKSEPEVFSYADLEASPAATTSWDGVRNYVARNNMRAMRRGDRVLFYHSRADPPHAAGVAEVVKEAYPDHTAWEEGSRYFDPKSSPAAPRWFMVDIRAVEPLPAPVGLPELRENPDLAEMAVVRKGQRVSVLPVTEVEFEEVLRMAAEKAGRR